MKTKEIKALIRSMVRECVYELLAEKYIETSINEIAGTKKQTLLPERIEQPKPKRKAPTLSRQEMAAKYGLEDDSPMIGLFEDTQRTNPVINGEGDDAPGTISERALEKSGIMAKDWSKFF